MEVVTSTSVAMNNEENPKGAETALETFRDIYGREAYDEVTKALRTSNTVRAAAVAAYMVEIIEARYYRKSLRRSKRNNMVGKTLGLPCLPFQETKERDLRIVPDILQKRGRMNGILMAEIGLFIKEMQKRTPLYAKTITILMPILEELYAFIRKRGFQIRTVGDAQEYVTAHNIMVAAHQRVVNPSLKWDGDAYIEKRYGEVFNNLTAEETQVYAALCYLDGTNYTRSEVEWFTGMAQAKVDAHIASLQNRGLLYRKKDSPYNYTKLMAKVLSPLQAQEYGGPEFWVRGLQEMTWKEAVLYNTLQQMAVYQGGSWVIPEDKGFADIGEEAFPGRYRSPATVVSSTIRNLVRRNLINMEGNHKNYRIVLLARHDMAEIYGNVRDEDAGKLPETPLKEGKRKGEEPVVRVKTENFVEETSLEDEDERSNDYAHKREGCGLDESRTTTPSKRDNIDKIIDVVAGVRSKGFKATIRYNFETGDMEIEI